MCTVVHVTAKARVVGDSRAGLRGGCEAPAVNAGNWVF